MIRLYIKQAWEMLKQNKLFSALYITGTALALAMTMAVFVAHYIKIAPIYPETDRANTYVLRTAVVVKGKMQQRWSISYNLLRNWWQPVKNAEVVSGVYAKANSTEYIQTGDGETEFQAAVTYTDPAFFQVFDFAFMNGKPFTQADHDSGLRNVVIGDDLAMKLFGSTDVVGRTFSMSYNECRVAGVVKNASNLTPNSYADVYMAYTTRSGYDNPGSNWNDINGNYWIFFKVKDAAQGAALQAEAAELVRKYNSSQDEIKMELQGPEPAWMNAYGSPWDTTDWTAIISKWVGLFFIFLLVPALNLSGMISTRMENRLPEMGISKAFGAGKGRLLRQVLGENLVLTCLGGFVGLCIAWLVLVLGSSWVFHLFDPNASMFTGTKGAMVRADMLFSPWVFVAAFAVCLLLNVISALIPAWRALRKDIVYSLNQKK